MQGKAGIALALVLAAVIGGFVYLMIMDEVDARTGLETYCRESLEDAPEGYQVSTIDVDCTGWASETMPRVHDRVMNCHHLSLTGSVSFARCLRLQDLLPPGLALIRNSD